MRSLSLLLILSLFSISVSSAPHSHYLDGVLPNGNFEDPPLKSNLNKTVIIGRNSLPKWEINGLVEYVSGGPQPGGYYLPIPRGSHAVRLGNEASISQAVRLTPGSTYTLSFGATRTCAQNQVLRIEAGDQSANLSIQTQYSDGEDAYAFSFVANANIVGVSFHNPGVKEDPTCGTLLDLIYIKEMPRVPSGTGNLLLNGNFENGPHVIKNLSNGILLPPQSVDQISPIPGWKVNSLKPVKYIDRSHFKVPSGKAAIELVEGRQSFISQVIETVPNKLYNVSFAIGDGGNGCHGSLDVQAFAAQQTIKAAFNSTGLGASKTFGFQFRAVSDSSMIAFCSDYYHTVIRDPAHLCGPVLDDVVVLPA